MRKITAMPQGGVYASYRRELPESQRFDDLYETVDELGRSLQVGLNGKLKVEPRKASGYSFCSSATYLLFCAVLEDLQKNGQLKFPKQLNRELADVGGSRAVIHGEFDGVGLFGHWNANGPGTARLFERLDLGSNFESFSEAKAGDFLKIFWNEKIGKGERGHLVVYLGANSDGSAIQVWSSNQNNEDGSHGYGMMWIDRDRIHRAVFSRLERPGNLVGWLDFSEEEKTCDYLVGILKNPSSPEEMRKVIGLGE
ncbi:MAG: hypothetical protein P1U58_06340 [Verrucomicrobiales bacterium]|nr:hypothetical protein [Verrucomicrobiales bacterium]